MTRRTRTPQDALDDLALVVKDLNVALAESKRLYVERDRLFVELREGFDKPVKKREMAEIAGVTEVAVIASLRNVGEKRGSKVR